MRRVWPAIGVVFALGCLAFMAMSCAPQKSPATDFLEPYKPALKHWTAEEEAAWALFPRYHISATLDLDAMRLTGWEQVRFVNRTTHSLNEIYFRQYPNLPQQGGHLVVHSVKSNGIPLSFEYDVTGTAFMIPCDPPLEPGQVALLELTFSVEIPDRAGGWVLFGRSQNIISLPDFYPILAVYDSQGWHVELAPAYADAGFGEAAFYQVAFTAPSELVIASTGVIITQTLQSDGSTTTHIVAGPIREFVIVASPDYEVASTEAYGTTVRSYFLRQDRAAGLVALERAASALRVYSDYFSSYPFSHMSAVEAPLTFRGMEYCTLNLFGVDTYRAHRQELSYLVVHEVAHQWWYNQIGNDPFNAAWLDEGLAEYSAYTYYWKAYGREAAEKLRQTRWIQPYEYAKATGADMILAQSVTEFLSSRAYETMVYAKGALFFDALRRAVGEETYYAILQEYVRRYRFRTVLPEDFFIVAQEVSARDLTPLIVEWILTAH